jgi:hypothetical protein
MKHFTDEVWLDFARRLLPSPKMELLRKHLDEGCEACNKLSEIWRAVARIAAREANYEPDESAVRAAKAAYGGTRRTQVVPRYAKMARLLFDSFLDPAAVATGVRSASSTARQLLHRDWWTKVRNDAPSQAKFSDPVRSWRSPWAWKSS